MIVSIVVAISENNAIGKDNQLLWHLPNELKLFKTITTGHCIIMGRKTHQSIGRPLPNRTNIVISTNKNLLIDGCVCVNSITEAIAYAKQHDENEAFIVGGGQIYNESFPLCDRIYLTKVHANIPDADTFFPVIDSNQWKITSSQSFQKDEKHAYDYDALVLDRVS